MDTNDLNNAIDEVESQLDSAKDYAESASSYADDALSAAREAQDNADSAVGSIQDAMSELYDLRSAVEELEAPQIDTVALTNYVMNAAYNAVCAAISEFVDAVTEGEGEPTPDRIVTRFDPATHKLIRKEEPKADTNSLLNAVIDSVES
jgi:hypothetical protein